MGVCVTGAAGELGTAPSRPRYCGGPFENNIWSISRSLSDARNSKVPQCPRPAASPLACFARQTSVASHSRIPARWVHITATAASSDPSLDQQASVNPSATPVPSPDARFEVVGSPFSLLSVSLAASQNLYTRRGTLVGLSGKVENVYEPSPVRIDVQLTLDRLCRPSPSSNPSVAPQSAYPSSTRRYSPNLRVPGIAHEPRSRRPLPSQLSSPLNHPYRP